MNGVLIVGATSCIAEHCARIWAARGERLFLVGRNSERLASISSDLAARGASGVASHCMDLNDLEAHAELIERAGRELGGIDIALVAHGVLPDQRACEADPSLIIESMRTNALSTVSLLAHIANQLESCGAGTIGVISSVAGDRGRASNYVYGAAKAMVTAYASGLRQRLHPSNVAVVTIKPGPIDTPMTKGMRKGLLWGRPPAAAAAIVGAIDARRHVAYVPAFWRCAMAAVRAVPERVFKTLGM